MPYIPQARSSRPRSNAAATIGAGLVGRLLGELEGEHRAEPAHLADRVVLRGEAVEARAHRLAERRRLREEARVGDGVEHGDRRGAGERVAAEGAAEAAGRAPRP